MGGYFLGRPTEPESGPAKTQEAQAGLHFKLHGLDKEQAGQPIEVHRRRRTWWGSESKYNPEYQLGR